MPHKVAPASPGSIQVIPVREVYGVLPCQHPLIAFKKRRFGFGAFLLSSQAGANQALGEESLPVLRPCFLIAFGGLAGQGFAGSACAYFPSSLAPRNSLGRWGESDPKPLSLEEYIEGLERLIGLNSPQRRQCAPKERAKSVDTM
jgi:hypothetical protein